MSLSFPVTGRSEYRHKQLFSDRFLHEPVAGEDCTVCHDVHFPAAAGQLTATVPALCFECHDDPASGKAHVHGPAGDGRCLACHYPHSSSRPGLLIQSPTRLCEGCHKEKQGGRHGDNVFRGECTGCHEPHASGTKGLLRGASQGGCADCHGETLTEEYRHTVLEDSGCPDCHNPHSEPPVATVPCLQCHSDLMDGRLVHQPVEDGCGTCHGSHSGPEPMQLTEKVPDLCHNCHDEGTGGRHGDVSVGPDCTRCHSSHSSQGQALLTDSALRSTCGSCHVDIILKEISHAPVNSNRCERCHDPHVDPPVPTSLCRDCHGGILDGRYDHEAASESCGNCHDAHGSRFDALLLTAMPGLCTECHSEAEGGRHGEVVLSEECLDCHDPHSALQPRLLKMLTENAACESCHRAQNEGQVVHTPVKTNDCGQCHDPHSTPPVEAVPCSECHSGIGEGPFTHDALEEGCEACHDIHSSGQNNLLVAAIPDLCLECHDEKEGGRHGTTTLTRECDSCHEPHTSPRKGLLKVLGDRSCTSCHSDMRTGEYIHSALGEFSCEHCHDPHGATPVMPPLSCQSCHPDVGDQSASHGAPARGRCLECHDPHSADSMASVKDRPTSGKEQCLECHRDVARRLERGRGSHSPVVEDECTVCHTDHSGEPPFTIMAFPADRSVPYDQEAYELCFSCHGPGLVQTKYTETDTGFRHRRWNLHNLHVVRDGQRGYACWVCHDAHSTDQPHLIKREVPYNPAYSLKIEYRRLENGGECRTNCHAVKEYLR